MIQRFHCLIVRSLICIFALSSVALCVGGLFASPVSASTTLYFGSIEKTYDDSGAVTDEKVYIPAGNSTAVKTTNYNLTPTTHNLSFLHSDHIGSTVLVTDSQGNMTDSMVYYPYGTNTKSEIINPKQIPNSNNQTDRLYTSQRKDESTNLYYYNARYYNPTTGRFLSADKAEGPNRYAYVGNNPVMRNDPSGNVICTYCNNRIPGFTETIETYSNDTQSIDDVGDAFRSVLAHGATMLGLGSFLPSDYRSYVSQKFAFDMLESSMIPGPATVTSAGIPRIAAQSAKILEPVVMKPSLWTKIFGISKGQQEARTALGEGMMSVLTKLEQETASADDFLKAFDPAWRDGIYSQLMATFQRARIPIVQVKNPIMSGNYIVQAIAKIDKNGRIAVYMTEKAFSTMSRERTGISSGVYMRSIVSAVTRLFAK